MKNKRKIRFTIHNVSQDVHFLQFSCIHTRIVHVVQFLIKIHPSFTFSFCVFCGRHFVSQNPINTRPYLYFNNNATTKNVVNQIYTEKIHRNMRENERARENLYLLLKIGKRGTTSFAS